MDFDHYLIIFDFDLGGGTVIRGRPLIDFFVPNAALIRVNTVLVIDNHT